VSAARRALRSGNQAAVGLGLLGLGVGLAEVFAPRAVARLLGVRRGSFTTGLVRGLGARELVTTAGLLASRRTKGWLWARVAGDAIDLALLGVAVRRAPVSRARVVGALAAVGGVAALDTFFAVRATRDDRTRVVPSVRGSITIARPIADVYRFWRALENAPLYMSNLEAIEVLDARRSRWTARGPAGTDDAAITWEAVVIDDVPNERFAWRSTEGAEVQTEGQVRFEAAPGDRGTEVHIELRYGPPRGSKGSVAAFPWEGVDADADADLEADLRRCKQLLETGHIVHGDGVPRPARAEAVLSGDPDEVLS
jgi:uncharacterized membrane protein